MSASCLTTDTHACTETLAAINLSLSHTVAKQHLPQAKYVTEKSAIFKVILPFIYSHSKREKEVKKRVTCQCQWEEKEKEEGDKQKQQWTKFMFCFSLLADLKWPILRCSQLLPQVQWIKNQGRIVNDPEWRAIRLKKTLFVRIVTNNWYVAYTMDLHPGKAVCPAPVVWTLGFWWHDRRLAALCAAAGHPDPSRTRAEWEWALAIAWGSPDGPPWLSVLQSGSLSVGITQREKKNDQRHGRRWLCQMN